MKLRKIIAAALCVVAIALVSVYALLTTKTAANAELAMVELQVENMTCGSCVANITDALGRVSGVESVDVSVTTGIGKITFNPQLVEPGKLTDTVTAAGYPATLKQLLNSEQYHALRTEETRLATSYVARIGEQLISRSDFDSQVSQFLKASGLQDRPESRTQAVVQTWQSIMQRTLLLQAAEQNQVVVHDGEVELRVQQLRQELPNLDEYIQSRYGSKEFFQRQLKEDMIISRNIDQFVLNQIQDKQKRQQAFNQWFQSLLDNAPIVIYDQQLKQTAGSAGGCGGSCCG